MLSFMASTLGIILLCILIIALTILVSSLAFFAVDYFVFDNRLSRALNKWIDEKLEQKK